MLLHQLLQVECCMPEYFPARKVDIYDLHNRPQLEDACPIQSSKLKGFSQLQLSKKQIACS